MGERRKEGGRRKTSDRSATVISGKMRKMRKNEKKWQK
jgi:hypothetical protein